MGTQQQHTETGRVQWSSLRDRQSQKSRRDRIKSASRNWKVEKLTPGQFGTWENDRGRGAQGMYKVGGGGRVDTGEASQGEANDPEVGSCGSTQGI